MRRHSLRHHPELHRSWRLKEALGALDTAPYRRNAALERKQDNYTHFFVNRSNSVTLRVTNITDDSAYHFAGNYYIHELDDSGKRGIQFMKDQKILRKTVPARGTRSIDISPSIYSKSGGYYWEFELWIVGFTLRSFDDVFNVDIR